MAQTPFRQSGRPPLTFMLPPTGNYLKVLSEETLPRGYPSVRVRRRLQALLSGHKMALRPMLLMLWKRAQSPAAAEAAPGRLRGDARWLRGIEAPPGFFRIPFCILGDQ